VRHVHWGLIFVVGDKKSFKGKLRPILHPLYDSLWISNSLFIPDNGALLSANMAAAVGKLAATKLLGDHLEKYKNMAVCGTDVSVSSAYQCHPSDITESGSSLRDGSRA